MKFKEGDYVKIVPHPEVKFYRGQEGLLAKVICVLPFKRYPYFVEFINGDIQGKNEIFDEKCLELVDNEKVIVELL